MGSDKGAPLYIKIIVIAIIIVVCFLSVSKKKKQQAVLKQKGRYTIGVTEGWAHNHRSSDYSVDYSFKFHGVEYKEILLIRSIEGLYLHGGKYIVKVDPANPANSEIEWERPVKVAPEYIPDTGWASIPSEVVFY